MSTAEQETEVAPRRAMRHQPTLRSVRLTESQLVDVIVEAAQLFGWRVSHFRPAQTVKGWRTALQGDQGLPDLVLARRGVVIMAEVKVGKNTLRPDQEKWRDAIGPTYWRLWTDRDLDKILEELR